MKIKNKIEGILFISGAYMQFLIASSFHLNYRNPTTALFFFISIILMFGLSAKGLIILFSDKEIKKDEIPKQI